jgi:TRAP transporter TAXI family solute receptor
MSRAKTESRADYVKVYGLAIVLTLAGFAVAYQFVEPAPPSTIHISAGSNQGAYIRFARAYSARLATHGITLVVHESAGSGMNLERLSDPQSDIDVALVQGGVGDPDKQIGLRSLGSVYYEPLWIFHRLGAEVGDLRALAGKRIAIGKEGSGTRAVALRLLAANDISPSTATLANMGGAEAAAALQGGEVDAIILVSGPGTALIESLLRHVDINLMSFDRAEAYTRRFRFLNRVQLPRGAVSLAEDIPSRDINLLAPTATLVVRDTLHPALINMLLQAADDVHRGGSLLERPGQFPTPRFVDFPLSDEAERFYRSGPPFLQRYLPFWAATGVDRLKVLLLPLLTVLFPLFKIVPPVYSWRVRRRIYRWYREVREIETDYRDATSPEMAREGQMALTRIERELVDLKVPLGIADSLYHLRMHIAFVRSALAVAVDAPSEPPDEMAEMSEPS